METWYLDCLRILTKHNGEPPVLHELASYCRRSSSAVYSALISLEHKGYVSRDARRRFVEVCQ